MRRENFERPSPKIETYLRGLNISEKAETRESNNHLKSPPVKKSKMCPRIMFGKVISGGVRGNLHANEEGEGEKEKVEIKSERIPLI